MGFGHHFVADKEFPDGSAAEERWIEVEVEMAGFDFFVGASQRCLVETHAL